MSGFENLPMIHDDCFFSREKRLFYICVPKNASRSILDVLKAEVDDGSTLFDAREKQISLVTVEEFNTFRKVAVIRDPLRRVLSFWADKVANFTGSPGQLALFSRYEGLAPYMSLDAFIEWLAGPEGVDATADPHFRSQYLFLTNNQGELVPEDLLSFERLEQDWLAFAQEIGLPRTPLKRMNTAHDDHRTRFHDVDALLEGLTARQRALLEERYAKDIALCKRHVRPLKSLESTSEQGHLSPAVAVEGSGRDAVLSPSPFQVFQRRGMTLSRVFAGYRPSDLLGWAEVPFVLSTKGRERPERVDVYLTKVARGKPMPVHVGTVSGVDLELDPRSTSQAPLWRWTITVPAGGWYAGTVTVHPAVGETATLEVGPFGVGEVFVVAGQSYMAASGDQLSPMLDPASRVAVWDDGQKAWRVARDPVPDVQPPLIRANDRGQSHRNMLKQGRIFQGGTIWPLTFSLLSVSLGVPVGMVLCACFSESIRGFQPKSSTFPALANAGRAAGPHRAVLWGHGESDALGDTSVQTYVDGVLAIRDAYHRAIEGEVPWVLAKGTFHIAGRRNLEGQYRIREAIDTLLSKPGFLPGPHKDLLGEECYSTKEEGWHFNGIGQQAYAALWYANLLALLSDEQGLQTIAP